MADLAIENLEADRARLRALCPESVADGLLGVFGQEGLKLVLGMLVLKERCAGGAIDTRQLSPGIRRGHINDAHRLDSRSWSFDSKKAWGLAVLHTAPELLFRCEQEVLVERVG